ncbi:hypothetical protein EUGRSUZ_B02993 [Eucalyptus grandis]|uniref:Uncharacterized protein n=2 Tax=Eucalyptus grandis TaxID=71139 RepID=A0ACC3LUK0_EUCGR|nr:hypothetical protein EUGRSUZ_B02993 [Eucalyptus grandis]
MGLPKFSRLMPSRHGRNSSKAHKPGNYLRECLHVRTQHRPECRSNGGTPSKTAPTLSRQRGRAMKEKRRETGNQHAKETRSDDEEV